MLNELSLCSLYMWLMIIHELTVFKPLGSLFHSPTDCCSPHSLGLSPVSKHQCLSFSIYLSTCCCCFCFEVSSKEIRTINYISYYNNNYLFPLATNVLSQNKRIPSKISQVRKVPKAMERRWTLLCPNQQLQNCEWLVRIQLKRFV